MYSLPFYQQLYKGYKMWRVTGILTSRSQGMAIEWRSDEYEKKSLHAGYVHRARSELRNEVIPWTALDGVGYHGRIFGAGHIRLRARSMEALDSLPGSEGPFWAARVGKLERSRAREFALASEAAIAGSVRLLE